MRFLLGLFIRSHQHRNCSSSNLVLFMVVAYFFSFLLINNDQIIAINASPSPSSFSKISNNSNSNKCQPDRPCPVIDYDVCTRGFKPVLKRILENECCPQIQCVSELESDNLELKIDYDVDSITTNKNSSSVHHDHPSSPSSSSTDNEIEEYVYDFISLNQTTSSEEADYEVSAGNSNDDHDEIEEDDEEQLDVEENISQRRKSSSSSSTACMLNGTEYQQGDIIKLTKCTQCICSENGYLECNKQKCPDLSDCAVRVTLVEQDECCQICTDECVSNSGKIYYSSQIWKEDDCIECKCIKGKKSCVAEMCETARCYNPIRKPGICCPICEDDHHRKNHYDHESNLIINNNNNNHSNGNSNVRLIDLRYPPHCKRVLSTFKCSLTCKYGYVLDELACPICKCSPSEMPDCKFPCEKELKYMPMAKKFCRCRSACGSAASGDKSTTKCSCSDGLHHDSNTAADQSDLLDMNNCDCKCDHQQMQQQQQQQKRRLRPNQGCYDNQNNRFIKSGNYWFDGSLHYCLCLSGRNYCTVNLLLIVKKSSLLKKDKKSVDKSDGHGGSSLETIKCKEAARTIKNKTRIWQIDKCLKCICKQGMLFCERKYSCSGSTGEAKKKKCLEPKYVEDDPLDNDDCDDDDCSSTDCDTAAASSSSFSFLNSAKTAQNKTFWSCIDSNNNKRLHGRNWVENKCSHCVCVNGEKRCTNQSTTKCSSVTSSGSNCDDDDRMKIIFKDSCCAECLSSLLNKSTARFGDELELSVHHHPALKESNSPQQVSRLFLLSIVFILVVLCITIVFLIVRREHRNTNKNAFLQQSPSSRISNNNINNNNDEQTTLEVERFARTRLNTNLNRYNDLYVDEESRRAFIHGGGSGRGGSGDGGGGLLRVEALENSPNTKFNIYHL